jgi:parvulin-like peptidyl-prolyl isomerase
VREATGFSEADATQAGKLPDWITPELMTEAREAMEAMGEGALTTEDVVGVLQNMRGVFEFLYGKEQHLPQEE